MLALLNIFPIVEIDLTIVLLNKQKAKEQHQQFLENFLQSNVGERLASLNGLTDINGQAECPNDTRQEKLPKQTDSSSKSSGNDRPNDTGQTEEPKEKKSSNSSSTANDTTNDEELPRDKIYDESSSEEVDGTFDAKTRTDKETKIVARRKSGMPNRLLLDDQKIEEWNLGMKENPKMININKLLKKELKDKAWNLFMKFKDVFAWEHSDLNGVDPKNVCQAQDRCKKYADEKRRQVVFKEGDYVFLRVREHSESLKTGSTPKLSPRLPSLHALYCTDAIRHCLLKSLCWAFAKGDMCDLSANTFRLMLRKHYYPPLDFWKSLLASWVQNPRGAVYVAKVFLEICRNCCNSSLEHLTEISSVRPDTEAFTVALKACANIGASVKAEEIMRQMTHFFVRPDNACFCSLMKAHEKGNGIDRILKVLLRMKQAQEVPSRITLNSLLAACINIGEVDVAAQVVLCWSGKLKLDIQDSDLLRDAAHHELHKSIRDWKDALERPCDETFSLLLKAYLQKNRIVDATKFIGRIFYAENSQYVPCSFALQGVLQLGLRDKVNDMLQV
ncbi:hypothetical protein L7F22_012282 [Adiantum nelumboides]|nr:hypothetical protein [Adiantum nelumboides]